MAVAVGRVAGVAHNAVADVDMNQVVDGGECRLVDPFLKERQVAEVDGEPEVTALAPHGFRNPGGLHGRANELPLVYLPVEVLQRDGQHAVLRLLLRVVAELLEGVDQPFGGLRTVGLARIGAAHHHHHRGAELVGLVDELLPPLDGLRALRRLQVAQAELLLHQRRLGGEDDLQAGSGKQTGGLGADLRVLDPAHLHGREERVVGDL